MSISTTLASLRLDLEVVIECNRNARVNHVTRIILDELDWQARKLLRAVRDDERRLREGFDPRLSILSLHGGEAAIRDIIKQSERHRVLGAVKERKAA